MALVLRRALGLDLGSHTVKAVELRQTPRGLEVGALREMPRRAAPRSEIVAASADTTGGDTPAPVDDFGQRLVQLLAQHALPVEHIVMALAADRVTTRRLAFPFGDRRRLAQAVPFEVEGELPFALEDVIVGWERVGGDRSRADVLALVAQRREIAATLETAHAAGIEPRILDAEGFVLGNLAPLAALPGVRLFADLGHRKTTFALAIDGNIVAQRAIALGGSALTQAIAREQGLSEADAEIEKHARGVLERRDGAAFVALSAAAGAVLERLAVEIIRTAGAFEPFLAGAGKPLEGLVLMGGTARLAHVDHWLAERTGLPTQRLSFPPGDTGSALVAGGDPALFGPAIALAVRGTLSAKTRLDFRRDEFALRVDLRAMGRPFRSTVRIALVAAGLAGTLLATSTWLESKRADRLEGRVREAYVALFPGQPVPPDPVAALRTAVRSAHERADSLGVYRGNLSALDLLTEISARVPSDLEVVFEELAIDRQVVRVRGFTKSFEAVDRLRAELAKFEPFAQIQVSEVKEETKRGGKSFSLTISLGRPGEEAA